MNCFWESDGSADSEQPKSEMESRKSMSTAKMPIVDNLFLDCALRFFVVAEFIATPSFRQKPAVKGLP